MDGLVDRGGCNVELVETVSSKSSRDLSVWIVESRTCGLWRVEVWFKSSTMEARGLGLELWRACGDVDVARTFPPLAACTRGTFRLAARVDGEA